jgi:hypothetical protein
MVVVLDRDEAERLQYAIRCLSHGAEDLGHGVDWARLRLKCNFDEIALRQRTRQLQQSARRRDGLEFSFSVPAIF